MASSLADGAPLPPSKLDDPSPQSALSRYRLRTSGSSGPPVRCRTRLTPSITDPAGRLPITSKARTARRRLLDDCPVRPAKRAGPAPLLSEPSALSIRVLSLIGSRVMVAPKPGSEAVSPTPSSAAIASDRSTARLAFSPVLAISDLSFLCTCLAHFWPAGRRQGRRDRWVASGGCGKKSSTAAQSRPRSLRVLLLRRPRWGASSSSLPTKLLPDQKARSRGVESLPRCGQMDPKKLPVGTRLESIQLARRSIFLGCLTAASWPSFLIG